MRHRGTEAALAWSRLAAYRTRSYGLVHQGRAEVLTKSIVRYMTTILFDIDGALLDHDAAERAGATALHRMTGATAPIEEFLLSWSTAQRYFSKFLKGELTYQDHGRARIRDVIDSAITDEAADEIFAQYRAIY